MRDVDCDVLIIGGGMAGIIAGIRAQESGQKTVLIRRGQSATSYSSGAIDIMGYLPEGSLPVSSPEEGLHAVASMYPLHPYSMLGYDESLPIHSVEKIVKRVKKPVEWIQEILKDSCSPLVGTLEKNVFPITVLGTTKPTCLVQKTMEPSSFEDSDVTLLFAGIKGHPDFSARSAAQSYLDSQVSSNSPLQKVGHCNIEIKPFGTSYNLSSAGLARYFDSDEGLNDLIKELKEQIDSIDATHVALSPVLGLTSAGLNLKRVQEDTGATVFELLSFPPSVPGIRLQDSLESAFRESGGHLMVGYEASSFQSEGDEITSVYVHSPRRDARIQPKTVVLATGKYIGGGVVGTEDGLRETIFDLMTVSSRFYKASELLPKRETQSLQISSRGHAVFGAGIAIDPEFRPVKPDGRHAYENLFAAGSILAGYNYHVEKSGLGVALSTGFAAGDNSAGLAKEVS